MFGQKDPLPGQKLPLNGGVLRNRWKYKYEAGRFANVNEIVKKAAPDVPAVRAKVIGDWLTIPLLDQKAIKKIVQERSAGQQKQAKSSQIK